MRNILSFTISSIVHKQCGCWVYGYAYLTEPSHSTQTLPGLLSPSVPNPHIHHRIRCSTSHHPTAETAQPSPRATVPALRLRLKPRGVACPMKTPRHVNSGPTLTTDPRWPPELSGMSCWDTFMARGFLNAASLAGVQAGRYCRGLSQIWLAFLEVWWPTLDALCGVLTNWNALSGAVSTS